MRHFLKKVGLGGVDVNENDRAKMWDKYFSIMLIAALVWLLFQWHLEYIHELSFDEAWSGDLIIWFFFFTESIAMLCLVDDKKRYVWQNYMNFIIIAVGMPFLILDMGLTVSLLRLLRVVFMIALFVPWLAIAYKYLTDNRLDTTIFTVLVILFTSSLIIVDIEPEVKSISDGLWWAWVTISTVGYGDIVPKTALGRLFGSFLILVGMGLFSVITANFASILIQRKQNKFRNEQWKKTSDEFSMLKKEEEAILEKLDQVLRRMDEIEKKQSKKE